MESVYKKRRKVIIKMENDKLKVFDENGKEKVYSLLVTFEYNNKNFVLYTDYEKDDNQNIMIYSAIYNPEDESGKLENVTNLDDINFINNYIKQLENDLKKGKT